MGRSLIGEVQVRDSDFLSEEEFVVASGIMNDELLSVSGSLNQQLVEHTADTTQHVTVSGIGSSATGDILLYDGTAFTPTNLETEVTAIADSEKWATEEFAIAMAISLG